MRPYDPSNMQVVGPATDSGPAKTRWALSVPVRRLAADVHDTCNHQGPIGGNHPSAPVAVCPAGPRAAGHRRASGDPGLLYGAGDPARPEVDGGRPGRRRGHDGRMARRAVPAAARVRGGTAVRAAAMAGGETALPRRGGDAGGPVPAPAAPPGGLPRP